MSLLNFDGVERGHYLFSKNLPEYFVERIDSAFIELIGYAEQVHSSSVAIYVGVYVATISVLLLSISR